MVSKSQLEKNISEISDKCKEIFVERNILLNKIGNIIHKSVPVSVDEKNNEIVSLFNENKRNMDKLGHHHDEILYRIDGYTSDIKIAGHRGYFLKGVGVLLNQALIQYGLNFLLKKNYTLLQPPFFMKKSVMSKTAQLEEFDESLYKISSQSDNKEKTNDDELFLIATSEQPISALHQNEVLNPKKLPIKYGEISTCFRKEAGSHGKDTWGIFRVHQFEKVEQFVICNEEDSWNIHDEMLKICEEFYQSLELPYRVISIVSGALNNAAAKKYDLEAWFPKLGEYKELVSASNCTDYQSRALNIKYISNNNKKFVHMLNATLVASERTLCCILENYQDEKGVNVPKVLQPYIGNISHIPYVNEAPKKSH